MVISSNDYGYCLYKDNSKDFGVYFTEYRYYKDRNFAELYGDSTLVAILFNKELAPFWRAWREMKCNKV